MMGRRAAVLAVLLILATAVTGCVDRSTFDRCRRADAWPEGPGHHDVEMCIDRDLRQAQVHIPTGLPSDAPLLILLHGGGGHAQNMRDKTGMDALAGRDSFIVAYPEGTPALRVGDLRTWNAVHCCGRAMEDGTDDIGFLAAFVERAVEAYGVDPGAVFVGGHSNGAMMAYRFAAERSDLVAGVASVAGAIGGRSSTHEAEVRIAQPDEPLSVVIIHARDDEHVPYEGGTGPRAIGGERVDLSVADAVAFWTQAIGADAGPTSRTEPGGVVVDAYGNGTAGTSVQVYSTQGGHGWPGGRGGVDVPSPAQPDASEVIAGFVVSRGG